MSFAADAAAGDQQFKVALPTSGTSKHGKVIALENFRLELADSADSSKVTIAPHASGAPNEFAVTAAADLDVTSPVGIAVNALADGRPGEGAVDVSEPGILTFRSPDAAVLGTVTATPEDLP